MLNLLTPESDPCCARAFAKDAEADRLNPLWVCPKCGAEYQKRDAGAIAWWEFSLICKIF